MNKNTNSLYHEILEKAHGRQAIKKINDPEVLESIWKVKFKKSGLIRSEALPEQREYLKPRHRIPAVEMLEELWQR